MNEDEKKPRQNISLVILDALKERGIGIEKLSQLSGISEHILQMLIEEKFKKLPSAPYLRGYMFRIADVLHLDGKKLWEVYIASNPDLRKSGKTDKPPKNLFLNLKLYKKFIVLGAIVLVFVILLIWKLFASFGGSELSITNIPDEFIVSTSTFVIEGKTNPSYQLAVNGEIVYSDKEGKFQKNVELRSGFNTFVFSVKKLFGKEYTLTKQIFYQESNKNKVE